MRRHVNRVIVAAFMAVCGWVSYAPAWGQETQPKTVSIPFDYDPPSLPYIRVLVKLNGDLALPFMLDTGTGFQMAVTKWAATQFKLPKSGPKSSSNDLRGKLTEVIVKHAEVGGPPYLTARLQSVFVADLDILDYITASPRLAGICGIPMVGEQPVQIDFVQKTITFFLDRVAPPKPPGAFTVKLHSVDGMYYVSATVDGGKPVDLLLDTGAVQTQVPNSALRTDLPAGEHNGISGGADGSLRLSDDVLVNHLELGGCNIDDVLVRPVADRGLLGMDVLSRFRVTLDCPNQSMTLEPRYDKLSREGDDPRGWLGAHIMQNRGKYIVSYVWPNSPAGKAGLQVNDEVVEFNGQPVNLLNPNILYSLGDGRPGSEVTISYIRSGVKTKLTLRRALRSGGPDNPFLGVDMTLKPGSPFIVSSIRKGSAADLAGLVPGDTVTEINGAKTVNMKVYQVLDCIDRPSAEIKIQRQGRNEPMLMKLEVRANSK